MAPAELKAKPGLFEAAGESSSDDDTHGGAASSGSGLGGLVPSLGKNRRLKSLAEIAAFAVAVAADEQCPRKSNTSQPPTPAQTHQAVAPRPPVLGGAETDIQEVTDANSAAAAHSSVVVVETAADANEEEGHGSFFLTDLSPSKPPSVTAHVPSTMQASGSNPSPQLAHHPSKADVTAAATEEQKRESIANHKRWIDLLKKQALPWFNSIPDRDVIICTKAVRYAKAAIQARYLGWRSALSMPLPVKITVKDVRIVDMAAMDLGGTSDPYCSIEMAGLKNTTSIQMETLSPVWENLDYEYLVHENSKVMCITVRDWDDNADDDLIGRCYIHAEDLLKKHDQKITRTLFNDAGADQGHLSIGVLCESMPIAEHELLPSDEPDSCAEQAGALARILWHLGVPRSKAAAIIKVVLRGEAPLHVIKRLGDVGVFSALRLCSRNWLVDFIGRWRMFTDFEQERRERIRAAKAPKLQNTKNDWDERMRKLQQNSIAAGGAKIDVNKHLNTEDRPNDNKEEIIKLALSFCDRPVLPVSEPEKAAKVVEDFLELYERLQGGPAFVDSLALDLIAEVLAKHERESRLVDQVDEELGRVQKAVKGEQGPDGIGLLPNPEPRKGMAQKWFKHKQEMEDAKKYMPMEYYLNPFIREHCKDIRGIRQAMVDLGHIFKTKTDAKSRKQVGTVILAIATVLRQRVAQMEEQLERKRKALGKLGAEMEAKKRQEQDEAVAMMRKWQMLNEEKVLPEVDEEITELLAYYKVNLLWSMSAAVAEERETTVARVLELRQSEINRWQADAEAAALAEEDARQRAQELAATYQALEDAEAAGDVEGVARMKKDIAKLEGRREPTGSSGPARRSGDSGPPSKAGVSTSEEPSANVGFKASIANAGSKLSKQGPAGNMPSAGGGQAQKSAAQDRKALPAKGKLAPKKGKPDADGGAGDAGSESEAESSESSSDSEAEMKKSGTIKAKGTKAKGGAKKKTGESSVAELKKEALPARKPDLKAPQPVDQASFPKLDDSKTRTKALAANHSTADSHAKEEGKGVPEKQKTASSNAQGASVLKEALSEETDQDVASSETFLPSLPTKDAEDLKQIVRAALKEQIVVSERSVSMKQPIKGSTRSVERMMSSRSDPTVASELHPADLMKIQNLRIDQSVSENLRIDKTVSEEAGDVAGVETMGQQFTVQDPQSTAGRWDDVADLLESDDPNTLGDFGILELKGAGLQRNLIARPIKEEKRESKSPEQNQVESSPQQPKKQTDHLEAQPPPVLKSIGGPHNLGGTISKEALPKMIYDAIMQVKHGRTANGPLESWRKALMTVVTWRERVFLVWKSKESFLKMKAEEQKKPRPEDLRVQQMVQMTTMIFLQYVDGIQKIQAQNKPDPDDAKHRAMEKHKKRLAMSHAHLMQPSRSHLPFDFLSYCMSEDTIVFQKELNRDAKFVASFRWKKLLLIPEEETSDVGVTNDKGKLLSVCVNGEEGVVHRLFTVWSDTWKLFSKTRNLIRTKAMQVPFYYRFGDTETLAQTEAVLVESIIPDMDKRKVQEIMEVEAKGVLRKAASESFDFDTNTGHALSHFDIDNILNYPGHSSTDSPRQQREGFESESDDAQVDDAQSREINEARKFLKTSRQNLRDLVLQELALIQAMIRRLLRRRQMQANLEKTIRGLAYKIVDAAVDVSEISKIAFKSMVEDQLLHDGSLPEDSEAVLLVRTKIPLERWAPGVGINWDQIMDDADLVREQNDSKRVLAHESRRISDIIGEARRQLQLKCGWAGERKFVAKGLTTEHGVSAPSPHSYSDMEITSGNSEIRKGHGRRVRQTMPLPPGDSEKASGVEFPNLGRQAYLNLSEKPAVANQIRIMRSRPIFQVKVKKPKDKDNFDPHSIRHSDVAGDRPGTFRSWGYGPDDYYHGVGLHSPPRTGYLCSARTGTGRAGKSRTGTGYLPSRKGTAYSRVDFIEESDEEPDFVAEPSFSYASATAMPSPRRGDQEEEEENHFTAALRQAARNAILERIAELHARSSPQKPLAGRQTKPKADALKHVSEELRANKDFMMDQVQKDPKALKYAAGSLKNDYDLVMSAVRQNGLCLELASEELRNNQELVMEAVSKKGRALKFASDKLKDTREVVAAAVDNDGESLFFASDRLKNDKSVAMLALARDGSALQHVSPSLRKDLQIALVAGKNDSTALRHADLDWSSIMDVRERSSIDKERDALIEAERKRALMDVART